MPPSDIPLYHAKLREEKKIDKYADKVKATGRKFAPYVVLSGGGLGKHTSTFLKVLSRGVKERHMEDPGKVIFRFLQEQACLRIRAFAEQVSSVARACKGVHTMGYDDTLDLAAKTDLLL